MWTDTKTRSDTGAVCTDVIRPTSVAAVGQHCYSWPESTDWAKGRAKAELRWCQDVLGVMCLTTSSVKVIQRSTDGGGCHGADVVFIREVLCLSSCQHLEKLFRCVELLAVKVGKPFNWARVEMWFFQITYLTIQDAVIQVLSKFNFCFIFFQYCGSRHVWIGTTATNLNYLSGTCIDFS